MKLRFDLWALLSLFIGTMVIGAIWALIGTAMGMERSYIQTTGMILGITAGLLWPWRILRVVTDDDR